MDVHALMSRIKEIEQAVEQSAANHNGLIGRLLEAKELLEKLSQPLNESMDSNIVVDAERVNPDNVVA